MADRFDPPIEPRAACKSCWLPRVAEAALQGVTDFVDDNRIREVEYDEKRLKDDLKDLIDSHFTGWETCVPCAEGDRIDQVYDRERDRRLGL